MTSECPLSNMYRACSPTICCLQTVIDHDVWLQHTRLILSSVNNAPPFRFCRCDPLRATDLRILRIKFVIILQSEDLCEIRAQKPSPRSKRGSVEKWRSRITSKRLSLIFEAHSSRLESNSLRRCVGQFFSCLFYISQPQRKLSQVS